MNDLPVRMYLKDEERMHVSPRVRLEETLLGLSGVAEFEGKTLYASPSDVMFPLLGKVCATGSIYELDVMETLGGSMLIPFHSHYADSLRYFTGEGQVLEAPPLALTHYHVLGTVYDKERRDSDFVQRFQARCMKMDDLVIYLSASGSRHGVVQTYAGLYKNRLGESSIYDGFVRSHSSVEAYLACLTNILSGLDPGEYRRVHVHATSDYFLSVLSKKTPLIWDRNNWRQKNGKVAPDAKAWEAFLPYLKDLEFVGCKEDYQPNTKELRELQTHTRRQYALLS